MQIENIDVIINNNIIQINFKKRHTFNQTNNTYVNKKNKRQTIEEEF